MDPHSVLGKQTDPQEAPPAYAEEEGLVQRALEVRAAIRLGAKVLGAARPRGHTDTVLRAAAPTPTAVATQAWRRHAIREHAQPPCMLVPQHPQEPSPAPARSPPMPYSSI